MPIFSLLLKLVDISTNTKLTCPWREDNTEYCIKYRLIATGEEWENTPK